MCCCVVVLCCDVVCDGMHVGVCAGEGSDK